MPFLKEAAKDAIKAKQAEKAIAKVEAAEVKAAERAETKAAKIAEQNEVRGGAHRDTSKPPNDGYDSHHCPAKNCYRYSYRHKG